MSRLRISLITPSFNHATFIRRTIDSVLEQTGNFDLDYRVLDGGSKDATVEILKSYGDRFTWTSGPDQGQVDCINKGLRSATGDVVGWVNSDDVLLPGALARVAAAFDGDPGAEWVHGRCRIIDEHDQPVRRWISFYKHYRSRTHTFSNLLTENYVSQMTAFWRRSVHDQIGYLDPEYDLAFDYDLFLKLAERGDPIYIDEELACFRWYETSKSGAGFSRQVDQTLDISARYGSAGPLHRARTHAKRIAIVTIYRAMSLGRSLLPKTR